MPYDRSIRVAVFASLLPACSLIIDTNPDGVIPKRAAAGHAGMAGAITSNGGGQAGIHAGNSAGQAAIYAGSTSANTTGTAGSSGSFTSNGGVAHTAAGASSGGVGVANGGSPGGQSGSANASSGVGGSVTTGGTIATGGTLANGGQATAGQGGNACGTPACTVGAYSCSGSTLQHCEVNTSGCAALVTAKACTGDTPVCNASAQRCDCNPAAPATCDGVNAKRVCSATTGQWEAVPCATSTPACGGGTCTACSEHSQCPGSACHLAGPKKGTCFEAQYVKRATTSTELLDLAKNLTVPGELAILLRAGTYVINESIEFQDNQEVAIVGDANPPIVSGLASSSDPRRATFEVWSGGLLYLAKLRQIGNTLGSRGVGASSNTHLWIDDFYSSGYSGAVVSASTEMHLRRSFLRSAEGSALNFTGNLLVMENSALSHPTEGAFTDRSGIFTGTWPVVFDIRYSTIAGGAAAINCDAVLKPSGSIRNSILLAATTSGTPLPPECSNINQSGNYAPTVFYNSAWFVDPAKGDFHLSAAGKLAILQTAQWAAGDPPADIDGQARPATGIGYPGVDQP